MYDLYLNKQYVSEQNIFWSDARAYRRADNELDYMQHGEKLWVIFGDDRD